MVFLTGSKFMADPPFNGWALDPKAMLEREERLPQGLAAVLRQAEFPQSWPGREILFDDHNPGLALRYETGIFETGRFQRILDQ